MTNAREHSSRLRELLHREQSAAADFLLALADFDRQRRWVEMGYTSLFYYLHRELKLSAGGLLAQGSGGTHPALPRGARRR